MSQFFFPLPPSSVVALPAFCPLGLPLTFFSYSFLLLPLLSGGFRLCCYLFSLVAVPSLSILPLSPLQLVASVSVLYSLAMVSAPALLLLCLSAMRLFLTSVFSSLRPLLPAFWFFLVGVLPVFLPPLLPRSHLSSFVTGSPFWDESVASVGSFTSFSGSLLGLCPLLPSFVVFLCPFLFLFFCLSASFFFLSSLVCHFCLVASLGCVRHFRCPPLWGLSSAFACFALIIVTCWAVSLCLGAVIMVSYGFPCGFLSCFCTSYLSCVTMLLFWFRSLFFSLGVSASEGGVHSPLAIGHCPSSLLLRLCRCLAWRSSARAPSPLDCCVSGDSSSHGSFHIGRCACDDSSSPTPFPIGRCAWGDRCDPPLDVC